MSKLLDDVFTARDCSVYAGREMLGRFMQTAPRRIVAYDHHDRELGTFRKLKDACAAISAAHREVRRLG